MHILLYERNAYTQQDLTQALMDMGVTLSTFTHTFVNKNVDDEFYTAFLQELQNYRYDAVMSVNYYPLIAQVCYETDTRYISWSYDCPLDVRNIEDTLGHPTNYTFLFDRIQTLNYQNMGFDNVYHLPLAVNTARLDKLIPSSNERRQYGADISFVGNLYDSPYNELIAPLPDYTKGFLNGLCDAQFLLYGCYLLDEMIHPDLLQLIDEVYAIHYPTAGFHIIKEELSYTMATEITHRERLKLLSMLGNLENTSIKLFSEKEAPLPPSVIRCGSVDYMTQMPLVFKSSKINLNITLKCLQSGVPLRALDIMGCGGFLLSNYQPELAEYFENGTDFVFYESLEHAKELAAYYLAHENERTNIAASGYEKVKEHFTYKKQLETIFKVSGLLV